MRGRRRVGVTEQREDIVVMVARREGFIHRGDQPLDVGSDVKETCGIRSHARWRQ